MTPPAPGPGGLTGVVRPARKLLGRIKRDAMRRLPMDRVEAFMTRGETEGIPNAVIAAERRELLRRRSFGPPQLDDVARLMQFADAVVPIRDVAARRGELGDHVVGMRHDSDHDIANCVKFAEWEADHGIRSTYFVLHTDWYYRTSGFTGEPSPMVFRALDRIASLGHEIGLHNNAIAVALQTDEDPVAVLDRELGYLRRHGFDVVGTAGHGDDLCRIAGFVNSEVFVECARPKLGAPDRELGWTEASGRTHRLRLRPVPMAELGLEYEAIYVPRDLYLSDTGGRWRRPFDDVESTFATDGGVLQVLIHPAWWALSGERYRVLPVAAPAAPPSAVPVTPTAAAGAGIADAPED